jgi:hypothetical protein
LDAAAARAEAESLQAVIEFAIDIGLKGERPLPFMICEICASQYGISRGAILPDEWFAEDRLPWTAPICGTCLSVLQAALSESMLGRLSDGT